MKLIDIGVNLTHPSFDGDRDQVLKEAEKAGVCPLIITGTGGQASLLAADYAGKNPGLLYATAGIHPHEAKNGDEAVLKLLRDLAGRKETVAIGECGLDYDRNFSPRDVQRYWFQRQIRLAAELDMPLFIHERDAFDDMSFILEQRRRDIGDLVIHCFTGTERALDRYLELGCHIGITGWICDERRGSHLLELIKKIPPHRLLLETDAPFLIPRNMEGIKRSRRNEPKFLPHIAEFIARRLGKDPELLAEETYQNARRIFKLP
jgi:TatD DNase family protein